MLNRRRFFAVSGTAVAACLTGCGARESRARSAAREGMLLRGNGTEPESLDPHVVRGAPEWTVVSALFEGLTVLDPATLRPVPGAAERWEVSPDGRTYTFHLRADGRWSDGTPVTAEDFAWSARRLAAPEMASAHVEDTLVFVRGVRAFLDGRGSWDAVGMQVVDTHTLRFELERPTPFFPGALTQFYPVPRAVIERHGGWTDRASAWTRAGNLVGNGAFALGRWVQNQEIVVRKNARYWNAAAVRLEGVTYLPFENPTTEETAFRNGQLHITSSVPLQKIAAYERDEPDLLRIVGDLGNYFYPFNTTKAPFDDVRVRRAFSLATDRERLVRNVVKGGRRAATAFTPPDMGGYTANPRLRFDAEAARALLAEAGYPGGRGFPTVDLVIDSRDFHRLVAEALQQMWRETLGVRVELRNEETRVLISSKRSMQFDLIRGSWNASAYQDPWYFLSPWVTGGLYNEAKWSDVRYDALLAQVAEATDPTLRFEHLQAAEDVLLEELPALPLFWGSHVFLMAREVRGYTGQPFADRDAKALWLEA